MSQKQQDQHDAVHGTPDTAFSRAAELFAAYRQAQQQQKDDEVERTTESIGV